MDPGERPHLPAIVGPRASYYITRDLGVRLEQWGQELSASRTTERAGGEVLAAVAMMRESARQFLESSQIGSGIGTSEPVLAVPPASSDQDPRHGISSRWSTSRVAEELNVSTRYVTKLCVNEALEAIRESGRWWVDPVSVSDYLRERKR